MLTPEYLARAPTRLIMLSSQLEEYIIRDIARRISTSEGEVVTQTALRQLEAARRAGLDMDAIQGRAAELTQKSEAEIMALFDDAARECLKYGNNLLEQTGGTPMDPAGTWTENTIAAIRLQTAESFRNITGSLGFAERTGAGIVFKSLSRFYQDTLDTAIFQISAGVIDYKTAVRGAIDKMASSGLRTVDYASGWQNRVDVAARRAVMTGITQLSGKLAERTAEALGTSLMEITAHPGARPSHAEWQGQIVDVSGRNGKYLTLSDIGYGTGDGFKGWNCRHDWFPYVEGVSEPMYTAEELRQIDPPPFQYNGDTYTAYEAAQQQRKIETAIRATKRKLMGYDAAGDNEAYTAAAVKLQRQRALYKDFSGAAGLPVQNDRIYEFGFGRKEAARASGAAKRRRNQP